MQMTDTITLDGVRRTGDGYLAANARVARTGIQIYSGDQVGRPDLKSVRVLRPEAEVMKDASLASFAHRPVTLDHPTEMVTADNWTRLAKGWTGDEVVRDGDFIRVPMLLADADTIKVVDGGKRELSMGYTCDLKWEAGKTAAGDDYDAIQTNIRANHLAVVSAARGGPQLRIGDEEKTEMTTRKIMFDGIEIEVTDQAAQAITKLQGKLTDAETRVGTLTAQLSTANTAIQTKDGENAALKTQLADAASPAKLEVAVAERSAVIADAAKVAGDASKVDPKGKTTGDIRRAAVVARMGDAAAKDMSDAAIEGAFRALAAGSGGSQSRTDPLATAIGDAVPTGDAKAQGEAAWAKNNREMADAWKRPASSKAA